MRLRLLDKEYFTDKGKLVAPVLKFFGETKRGITVIFETNCIDSSSFEDPYERGCNAIYFHYPDWDKRKGIPDKLRDELLLGKNPNEYQHVIYVKYRICNGGRMNFGWTLAHEIRHIVQRIEYSWLPKMRKKLLELLDKRAKKTGISNTQYDLPDETDADIHAKLFCLNYFGKSKTVKYIKKMQKDKKKDGLFKIIEKKNKPLYLKKEYGNKIRELENSFKT